MFWSIVGRSTRLGMKAGFVLGGGYFPAYLLVGFIIGTLWNIAHPDPRNIIGLDNVRDMFHDGPPTGLIFVILLAALSGGLAGIILGFLNGVLIAAVTALVSIPQTQSRFYSRALITTCVLLSFIGTSGFLYLLFATDLFTNFSDPGTPGHPSGPTRMIGLLLEPASIAVFILVPNTDGSGGCLLGQPPSSALGYR